MRAICAAVLQILERFPDTHVVFPMHRNPVVREVVAPMLSGHDRILLTEPQEYVPFVHLMKAAHIVLTDSGGAQEEAPGLGKPVLVLRNTTERPEGVHAGTAYAFRPAPDVQVVSIDPFDIAPDHARIRVDRQQLRWLVGVLRDDLWGPVLTVGLGGVWTEVLKDTAVRVLPVQRDEVEKMLGELRGAALLRGARGQEGANLQAVSEVIYRVGNLALALGPQLDALEINPLLVKGSRVEALDVLVNWRE